MKYSVVVATRNRLSALELSLPRMLAQSVPPDQLVVVDSSDDHAPVAEAVRRIGRNLPVRITIIQSERGLTRQRNIGLAAVENPVVFFPDDDSILFPGVAEEIMSVYRRDASGQISAVCAWESPTPPPDFPLAQGYSMSRKDRINRRFQRLRLMMESTFFPDPTRILGADFIAQSPPLPTWAAEAEVIKVESMTGFRMTFRTDVIRKFMFDTNLQRYSLLEDRDASFGAWRFGAVVVARRALIFHFKSPERRDSGHWIGTSNLLNLAYVIAKHTPANHPARAATMRQCRYKTWLYRMSAGDQYGRERLQGASQALAHVRLILEAQSGELEQCYRRALDECQPRPDGK